MKLIITTILFLIFFQALGQNLYVFGELNNENTDKLAEVIKILSQNKRKVKVVNIYYNNISFPIKKISTKKKEIGKVYLEVTQILGLNVNPISDSKANLLIKSIYKTSISTMSFSKVSGATFNDINALIDNLKSVKLKKEWNLVLHFQKKKPFITIPNLESNTTIEANLVQGNFGGYNVKAMYKINQESWKIIPQEGDFELTDIFSYGKNNIQFKAIDQYGDTSNIVTFRNINLEEPKIPIIEIKYPFQGIYSHDYCKMIKGGNAAYGDNSFVNYFYYFFKFDILNIVSSDFNKENKVIVEFNGHNNVLKSYDLDERLDLCSKRWLEDRDVICLYLDANDIDTDHCRIDHDLEMDIKIINRKSGKVVISTRVKTHLGSIDDNSKAVQNCDCQ